MRDPESLLAFFSAIEQFVENFFGSSLVQLIIGELVVGLTLVWVGQRSDDRRLKADAIRELMVNRGDRRDAEFRKALNKVTVVFHADPEIRKDVRQLYNMINSKEPRERAVGRAIVELIHKLCQSNGFTGITEYDIDQSFTEQAQDPQEAPVSPSAQTPATTPQPAPTPPVAPTLGQG